MENITCEVCPVYTPRRLQWTSSTVNEILPANKVSKKQLRSNHNVDLINTLPNPIDHSATSLKKKKHVSRISTKFSCRLELLGSRFLRIYCFLVLGLDLAVGLVPDNLPNFCTGDFSIQLLRDNQSRGHRSITS